MGKSKFMEIRNFVKEKNKFMPKYNIHLNVSDKLYGQDSVLGEMTGVQ